MTRHKGTLAAASAALLLLLVGGCAGSGEPEAAQAGGAELRVEVFSGFGKEAPSIAPAPIHVLVDITSVLNAEDIDGPEARQLALARELTEGYFEARPELVGPEFHPFHRRNKPQAGGERCAELGSGGEFYASQALTQLRDELVRRKQQSDARVLLFTRFENECTPKLCEAAAELVEPGSWLEVIGVGPGTETPACLAELRPSPETSPTAYLGEWRTSNAPAFTVEAFPAPGEGQDGGVLGRGQAWGAPVPVAPGLRQVRIELDPPAVIGPLLIGAGQKLRVRLLDFPLSAPELRSWRVENLDETAAPKK